MTASSLHPRALLRFDARPGLICLAAVILFMGLSTLLYWPVPEMAFRTDESPAAWLSSAQMWALALLALRLWQDRTLPSGLALWLALAMMGMSFDEQFMLHEHWKYGCPAWTAWCRLAWVTELPMLLVGALGALTVLAMFKAISARRARVQLGVALLIGLFALILRFTEQPASLLPFKAAILVLAQTLFGGVLLGIRSAPLAQALPDQVHS